MITKIISSYNMKKKIVEIVGIFCVTGIGLLLILFFQKVRSPQKWETFLPSEPKYAESLGMSVTRNRISTNLESSHNNLNCELIVNSKNNIFSVNKSHLLFASISGNEQSFRISKKQSIVSQVSNQISPTSKNNFKFLLGLGSALKFQDFFQTIQAVSQESGSLQTFKNELSRFLNLDRNFNNINEINDVFSQSTNNILENLLLTEFKPSKIRRKHLTSITFLRPNH